MLQKLREHPSVTRLLARYEQLPRRDQQALKLLLLALVAGFLYFGIWRPAASFHDQAQASRENAESLLLWMQENRQDIRQLAAAGGGGSQSGSRIQDGRGLMTVVTRTAGEAGLSLQRFEPSGDSAIRIWLDNVPFNQVATWIENLSSEYGIVIDQAALDRQSEPGIVSVRMTLAI